MDMERSRLKEGSDSEYETYTENVTVNSMIPLWRKTKKILRKRNTKNFIRKHSPLMTSPARYSPKSGGYNQLSGAFFIPEKADYNYYSKNFEKGLALYSSGVKIMDKCADLLPDCFSFVKGVVDSEDLS